MKTYWLPLLAAFFSALLFSNCQKDKDGNCTLNPQLNLEKVEPNANPPGYEIKLTGNGFTDTTIVRFDNLQSTKTRRLDASTLIATIPSGIIGSAEVSISDGECLKRFDRFEVFADFPNSIPFSPLTIIIPQAASLYPTGGFQNAWVNVNDPNHSIFLQDTTNVNGFLGPESAEYHSAGNTFLNNNPVTGYIRFDETAQTSDIRIEVDRRSKPGGELEIYTGEFIDPAVIASDHAFIILLTSEKDGRQLILQSGN